MRPFSVSAHFSEFCEIYPSAADVARLCLVGGNQARLTLARLWLSEGIPFAFRQNPALYEVVRVWLASRLRIDPKDITLIGSARLGQSLFSNPIGSVFSKESDLDFTVVSSMLFEKLASEFNSWAFAYESGSMIPHNDRERRFWEDNIKRGPDILGRGFIDSEMIPLRKEFPCTREIGQAMYLLTEKLRITPGGLMVRHSSIRTYRSWEAFARQMSMSLSCIKADVKTVLSEKTSGLD